MAYRACSRLAVRPEGSVVQALLAAVPLQTDYMAVLLWPCGTAVVWSKHKDTFPFLDGVSVIVISWFTSPILCAIAGAGLFLFTRHAGEP